MNSGNAVGFITMGTVMSLLPFIAPAYFSQMAVDGSSARALWVQLMGAVQLLLGLGYLVNEARLAVGAALVRLGTRRGALATADWQTGEPGFVIATGEPAITAAGPSFTMDRGHALRRMLAWTTGERIEAFLARSKSLRLGMQPSDFAGAIYARHRQTA